MDENKKKRVVIILQARMGASRLPGKPLKKVLGRSLLSYQLERLRRVYSASEIVVATTMESQDDAIISLCEAEKVAYFRGSSFDVLDRYYQAAKLFNADYIVRVTGDCPIIDPEIIDQVINEYLQQLPTYDYVSNSVRPTYPRGLDTEIFSFPLLEYAHKDGKLPQEREHVTVYFYTHPEIFSIGNVASEKDISQHRWTVDTQEDFELISKILTTIYPYNPNFNTNDVLALLDENPEWVKINAHIKQKPVE